MRLPLDIEITLNGQSKTIQEGTTILDVLKGLELLPERVAVEYNLQILKKDQWSLARLREGDRLEIVQFVGGGS